MSKQNSKRFGHIEKNRSNKSSSSSAPSAATTRNDDYISKHMKKVYPIGGLYKTCSSLSLSSLSLSLSQNSNDSSLTTDSSTPLDQKIALALGLISSSQRKPAPTVPQHQQHQKLISPSPSPNTPNSLIDQDPTTRRCNWITKNSGKPFFFSLSLYLSINIYISIKRNSISNNLIYNIRSNKFEICYIYYIYIYITQLVTVLFIIYYSANIII